MPFEDKPQVTPSAERSEESVQVVREWFSLKNGFISRDDVPDYGADLHVEIVEDGGATTKRFLVQIKSSQRMYQTDLSGRLFVAHSFLTSRLGYLCRYSPGYGLIVLYDETSRTAYFDYVEAICSRIESEKEGGDWRQQQTVRIHIPIESGLSLQSIKAIHSRMVTRFRNHDALIQSHGKMYGIPVLASDGPHVNFDDPAAVSEIVEKYGAFLFNQRDFNLLLGLISKLTFAKLSESPEIAFTAAIAFAETGHLVEADYHIGRLLAKPQALSDERRSLIECYRADIDFRFGRIDIGKYLAAMQKLLADATSDINKLSFGMRIDYLLSGTLLENLYTVDEGGLYSQIMKHFDQAKKADIEELPKRLLLLFAAGNLFYLGTALFARSVTSLRIREKTFGAVGLDIRMHEARRILEPVQQSTLIIEEVWNSLSEAERSGLVGAHIQYRLSYQFVLFDLNTVILGGGQKHSADQRPIYASRYSSALWAYNTFLQAAELDEAYASLTTAYEIAVLHDYMFGEGVLRPNKSELLAHIGELGAKMGRKAYESPAATFLSTTLRELQEISRGKQADVAEGDFEKFALTFVKGAGIPLGRLPNVVGDLQASARFRKKILSSDAVLLQNLSHTKSPLTLYAEPVIHIGICRRCGFETEPSKDIEKVVDQYLRQHGERCRS